MPSMSGSTKRKQVKTTAFADFIRNASAGEKKRVYSDVLKRASDRQNAVRAKKSAHSG